MREIKSKEIYKYAFVLPTCAGAAVKYKVGKEWVRAGEDLSHQPLGLRGYLNRDHLMCRHRRGGGLMCRYRARGAQALPGAIPHRQA